HPQWQADGRLGAAGRDLAVGAAREAQARRHQVRLRHGDVRLVHRAPRRPGRPVVRDPDAARRGQARHHHRRPVAGWHPSGPEGVAHRAGAPVRLLPVGADHAGGGLAGEDAQAHARADRAGDERQPLPLRDVRPDRARHRARRPRGGVAMAIEISRREFVVGATAGLTFAFALDLGRVARAAAQSAGLSPNVWVTINPDDTITIVSAADWTVPVTELSTEPSVIVHQRSGRRISYGDVAKFAKVPAELPKMTPADLKKPAQFRLIGKSLPRVELPDKVVGRAKFGIDAE